MDEDTRAGQHGPGKTGVFTGTMSMQIVKVSTTLETWGRRGWSSSSWPAALYWRQSTGVVLGRPAAAASTKGIVNRWGPVKQGRKRNPRSNSPSVYKSNGPTFYNKRRRRRSGCHASQYGVFSPKPRLKRNSTPPTHHHHQPIHSLRKNKTTQTTTRKKEKTRPAKGLEWVKTKGMKNFQKNLQNGRSRPPK